MSQQELRRFISRLITEENVQRQVALAVQPYCSGISLPCTQWAKAEASAEALHSVVLLLRDYVQGPP